MAAKVIYYQRTATLLLSSSCSQIFAGLYNYQCYQEVSNAIHLFPGVVVASFGYHFD